MKVKKEICNAFNANAYGYEKVAVVQRDIGEHLLSRLDDLKVMPRNILDLGCGVCTFTELLKKRFPKARIFSVDVAWQMLVSAKENKRLDSHDVVVNADMMTLPFPQGLFDLVFSNQVIHWAALEAGDPQKLVLREIYRVLNQEGCFLFSTLGPDTFFELKHAWENVNAYAHVNAFRDMHDMGDLLLSEHFSSPVVDMEMLSVHYASFKSLLHSLKAQGVRNIHPQRNPGLTGKTAWKQFENAMQQFQTKDGYYPLTYEVIYGHAFKTNGSFLNEEGDVFIPVSQLQRR